MNPAQPSVITFVTLLMHITIMLPAERQVREMIPVSAEVEVAAECLFTSPPRTQPLSFEALPLRTQARTVPPTPGTALKVKVQSNLEKSLGSRFDVQIKRWGLPGKHVGRFQYSA